MVYFPWHYCCCLAAMLCSTLRNPMDWSTPGSSVHGISQARILEWIDISFFRDSSRPRDQTHVSCIGRQILYHWATREAFPCINFSNAMVIYSHVGIKMGVWRETIFVPYSFTFNLWSRSRTLLWSLTWWPGIKTLVIQDGANNGEERRK